jgi:hypothetical protein
MEAMAPALTSHYSPRNTTCASTITEEQYVYSHDQKVIKLHQYDFHTAHQTLHS